MSEHSLWGSLRRHLAPFGVMKRIENRVDLGTPDVAYRLSFHRSKPVAGWMELKNLEGWPVRPGTPVVIEHLTLEQVLWLEEWRDRAWLVMRIGREVLVGTPSTARALYGREMNRVQLAQNVAGAWPVVPFPTKGLLEVLTR